jgi:hypothetical protein
MGVSSAKLMRALEILLGVTSNYHQNKYTLQALRQFRKTNLIKAIISCSSDFAAIFLTSPFSSNLHV